MKHNNRTLQILRSQQILVLPFRLLALTGKKVYQNSKRLRCGVPGAFGQSKESQRRHANAN